MNAPRMLPSPPMITAKNAYIRYESPSPVDRLWFGSSSPPARPARKKLAITLNAMPNDTLSPSTPDIQGSAASACISLPNHSRWMATSSTM
ncbi:hypothetical protein D9M72_599390 [compost metagenome]